MAFPAEYTLLGNLEFPVVTGTHTDFVALVQYADFTTAMLASIDDGGGDLRFSSDSAGTTQLPCEVVGFDKVGGKAEIHVKAPSVSTGAIIYVWGDNTGDSQPAVTSPFGRNAVWSDYYSVFHGGSATDSTGEHSFAATGTPTSEDGPFGSASGFTSSNYYSASASSRLSTGLAGDFTVQSWFLYPVFPSTGGKIILGQSSSTSGSWWQFGGQVVSSSENDILNLGIDDGAVRKIANSAFDLDDDGTNNVWYSFVGTRNQGVDVRFYVDGAVSGSPVSNDTGDISSTKPLSIGSSVAFGTSEAFSAAEVRLRPDELSANWVATEYENQSSSGPYFIATDAVATGPNTPINPSITNLQATSARLNWEQG